jgi:hypothetical protein
VIRNEYLPSIMVRQNEALHMLFARLLLLCGVVFTLLAPAIAHAEPPRPPTPRTASAGAYALSYIGKAVNFDLSGMEPDFDPIYKVVVTGALHDLRAPGLALPDATLVLSMYLEAFQPDTTPILPDLLHPDQTATDLGGFLTGKAALVSAGGHVVYRGNLLAEIFADSTEHLVVDLYPANGGPSAPALRLQGVVTLKKGGSEAGKLRALEPLARALLAVPKGRQPSWQSVISSLSVAVPAMLGTAGSSGSSSPQQPGSTIAPVNNLRQAAGRSAGRPAFVLPLMGGGVVLILTGVALLALRRRPSRSASPSPPADTGASADPTAPAGP